MSEWVEVNMSWRLRYVETGRKLIENLSKEMEKAEQLWWKRVRPTLGGLPDPASFPFLIAHFRDSQENVISAHNLVKENRQKEYDNSFCNHPMCKVGVQIEVKSKDGDLRRMLIGDMVPSGNNDGYCADSMSDSDIVLRYRDLSHLLNS